MSERSKPCLVVGYDGSPPARAAVEYAAERAGRGGRIRIVHAVGPMAELGGRGERDSRRPRDRRSHGRAVLDALLMEAGEALLDSDFELELVTGSAAEALTRVAEREAADEIVLGSRGQGRIGSALGSVSHEVLRLADRPVVVIPSNAVPQPASASSGNVD